MSELVMFVGCKSLITTGHIYAENQLIWLRVLTQK